ncbi:MAG: hypothetical protein JZU63_14310, partial [Rhodoferax sp.]|nr:hypothetical protein [Rhodoferax sp.]
FPHEIMISYPAALTIPHRRQLARSLGRLRDSLLVGLWFLIVLPGAAQLPKLPGPAAPPAAGTAVNPEGYKETSFLNRAKPALGLVFGGPLGMMLGKGIRKDNSGQSGFSKFGDNLGFAEGGATSGVPIVAAGGEYVIPPEDVVHIGGGDLDHGHKVLDAFVKKMRQKTIKTLQNLPGPKKD